jgi:hypothetical protein
MEVCAADLYAETSPVPGPGRDRNRPAPEGRPGLSEEQRARLRALLRTNLLRLGAGLSRSQVAGKRLPDPLPYEWLL